MPTDRFAVGPVVVREAGPEEWPEIAELTTEVYAALAPSCPPPSWTSYLGSIAATITQPGEARRLVVDVGGRIAASVLLCPPSPGPAGRGTNPHPELRLLAVRADCRNSGLAGRLIEACEQWARRDGHDAITLHTTSLMPAAKAMYERRGYLRAPELDFEPGPGFVVWGYRRPLL
jgi:GNAT superfamily N-acetyltransferase